MRYHHLKVCWNPCQGISIPPRWYCRHVAKAIDLDQPEEVAMLKFDQTLTPQQAVVYVKFTGMHIWLLLKLMYCCFLRGVV